jgi:hypothetical protein
VYNLSWWSNPRRLKVRENLPRRPYRLRVVRDHLREGVLDARRVDARLFECDEDVVRVPNRDCRVGQVLVDVERLPVLVVGAR